jgi:hypothetical protein
MRSEIINNRDIDRSKWDDFTINSPSAHIFNLSWYLDVVYPDWQALIITWQHEWIAVLPLFPRKKYGFNISLQPLLVRYSGVVSKEQDYDQNKFYEFIKEYLERFSICHFTSPFLFLPEEFQKQKITYKLDLTLNYEHIFAGFKSSLRNKVHNFNPDEFTIEEDKSTDDLIHLYQHYGDLGKFKVTDDYFGTLSKLFQVASEKKMAKIITARNPKKQPVASMLFFYFGDTIYLFIGLTRQEYKKTAIHPYLISEEIRQNAGKFNKLDFLGSMIPGVAKFNMSFGSQPYAYQEVILKKFPFNLLPI